jgi:hypothetical protein
VVVTVERALLLAVLAVLLIDMLLTTQNVLRRQRPLRLPFPLCGQRPDGKMQGHALAPLESAIFGIYAGDTPVRAAAFISDTLPVALTVERGASPAVGALLRRALCAA